MYSVVILAASLFCSIHAYNPAPVKHLGSRGLRAWPSSVVLARHRAALYAEGGGGLDRQKESKSKSSLVLEREEEKEPEEEGFWRVILHNDEIHTFEFVCDAVTKVVPTVSMKKAYMIARSVHTNGAGTIATLWKDKAMMICMALQTLGLTMSIAEDKDFEKDGGGDGPSSG